MNGQGLLEFASDDSLAGFRLEALEVYNWGTFHKQVWRLDLNSRNSLLTGDIGSGKSTLVDAVTTLLVPAQRIAYNKAAGAATKERSLLSYVRGYYKSERSDLGHTAKSVALRDHNSYSVILGVFKNQGYLQEVTLAQVFWSTETKGQPNRFYLIADCPLSIADHFSGFGPDISQLKKRLKKMDQVTVFDTFPKYGAGFRRRFGINNEQAMALFHQTVSMKSVGNLTDFVRDHMLEAFDVAPRINALTNHFDDLNRAHEAVLKAKQQVRRLTPLVEDCHNHDGLLDETCKLRQCRDTLTPYFACHKLALFQKRLTLLADNHGRLDRKIIVLEAARQDQSDERDQVKQAIAKNGGDRLERIGSDLTRLGREKEKRKGQALRYKDLARGLSLNTISSPLEFEENLKKIHTLQKSMEQQEAEQQNLRSDIEFEFRGLTSSHDALVREIDSLSGRKSNIQVKQIQIREELCTRLSLRAQDLPFAGELIQVRQGDKTWEGAAERLLHNFGLSLLVPEKIYGDVAAWVDATHLRGRLVYYLVKQQGRAQTSALHTDSLVHKLAVKPNSSFYAWVEHELSRRFDYACCTDMAQFKREPLALTQSGQIKSGGIRHEKDDRRDIKDRSNYILGWTNESKIRALKQQRQNLEIKMQRTASQISDIDQAQKELKEHLSNLIRLGEIKTFSDLDWQSVTLEISRLAEEKKHLEETSNILHTLNLQLEALEKKLQKTEQDIRQVRDSRSKIEEKQTQTKAGIKACESDLVLIRDMDSEQKDLVFKTLDTLRHKVFETHVLTLESCDNKEKTLRQAIQRDIDNLDKRLRNLEEKIVKTMHGYSRDFPLETREVDDAVSSGPEYGAMLDRLETDNLPRFENRFKALLNENTIREVANFQSQLLRERETIRERIHRINTSLSDIEYNPGRYILLEAQLNADADIRDFQQQLRACTEGALTGSEDAHYSESKFLQVRELIQRFKGREGSSDLDQRWTRKVTDVRNWFVFAASERWREDDKEYEHYTDSGGKSGGQKEKLAYTVLAASLAYQFGLEWGAVRSRSFRFVAIDEAFGRGSDESTRYSLELFKKLNLQLLIVTPLQKIHIIEPFVSGVGLVYSRNGKESQLRNMSVESYQEARKENQS